MELYVMIVIFDLSGKFWMAFFPDPKQPAVVPIPNSHELHNSAKAQVSSSLVVVVAASVAAVVGFEALRRSPSCWSLSRFEPFRLFRSFFSFCASPEIISGVCIEKVDRLIVTGD